MDDFPAALRGKKVLLTTESLGPVNGVSRTTGSLVDYLRRHGVELAVVAPHFPGLQQRGQELRLPGYPLPYNPDLTVVYPFRLDDVYEQTFQPDLIYVASPASLGFQVLLQIRQLARPPAVLLNFQTDLSAYGQIIFPPPLDRFAVWLLERVQGFLFRHPAVHTIFYPCSDVLRYLQKAGAPVSRSVRLGRGVDTALFQPARRDEAYRREIAPNGEIILVTVCRLAPEKGFEFLARVAERLVQEKLPFKLLIVGGNRSPVVESRVLRLFEGVRDHVLFTGFQIGGSLARAYASADLFLHCSITETFGLVVLEAMASGVPVVARDQGGPSDIILDQQTGYLVPPGDLESFVTRVRGVAGDRQLLARMALAARQYADDTTWEKINRRVAVQMVNALQDQDQEQDHDQDRLHAKVSPPSECSETRGLVSFIEQVRMTLAVGMVYFFWFIAVFPLIVHGQQVVPKMLQILYQILFFGRRVKSRFQATM